ncbi:MAG: NAD(P)/FAD-dependent oxidoreductase [Hyphomicrobiales bacterium]
MLIVGAGLAGLSLADQLQEIGIDYQLIEARERIGGRILSHSFGDGSFDMGPAWFWPGQPRLAAMAKRFDLEIFEQYAAGEILSEDNRGTVRRGIGFSSMQGSYRMAGGLGELTYSLAAVLPKDRLHLNSKLKLLERQDARVNAHVEMQNGSLNIEARKVVLAIPPRVAERTIQCSPDISAQARSALSAIPTWMAGQAKIVAIYDRPYWREAGLSGDAMSQFGPLVEIHDASPFKGGPNALFGFVGVPADMRSARDDLLLELVREQLHRLFGGVLPEPQKLLLQDWAQEEFTATSEDRAPVRGHLAYGYPNSFRNMWNNSLILGSTEVAPQFGGYLEGALEAAENALKLLQEKNVNVTNQNRPNLRQAFTGNAI